METRLVERKRTGRLVRPRFCKSKRATHLYSPERTLTVYACAGRVSQWATWIGKAMGDGGLLKVLEFGGAFFR